MTDYALLVFDWDGTLVDSIARIGDSMKAAARETALPERDDTRIKGIIGLGSVVTEVSSQAAAEADSYAAEEARAAAEEDARAHRRGLWREMRDSWNHGCSIEVWFRTISNTIFMPRPCTSSMRRRQSARVPYSGATPV